MFGGKNYCLQIRKVFELESTQPLNKNHTGCSQSNYYKFYVNL